MDSSLAFAAELEERDAALAAQLELLLGLGDAVDGLRVRALELAELLARVPDDRQHLEDAHGGAEQDVDAARSALAEAERALERARGEDARATAERHRAHAATDLRTAAERVERLAARREALELEAEQAAAEASALGSRASELARRLDDAPRASRTDAPGEGLAELAEWGSRAHAAVLVARSGVETERERVVREANELAAAVLGEPLYATSVAGVRERLAERLG